MSTWPNDKKFNPLSEKIELHPYHFPGSQQSLIVCSTIHLISSNIPNRNRIVLPQIMKYDNDIIILTDEFVSGNEKCACLDCSRCHRVKKVLRAMVCVFKIKILADILRVIMKTLIIFILLGMAIASVSTCIIVISNFIQSKFCQRTPFLTIRIK